MAPAGRGRGVTLLELLVVLALVGVLAALAYPSYRGYLARAHRMEAIEALLTVAAAQERFHLQHGRYADGFEPEVVPGLALAPVTSGGRYALRLEGAPPGGFAALASPCSQLALDGTGRRWALDGAGRDSTTDCWR